MRRHIALLALLAGGISIVSADAQAAENASGWYALGTKASMAGFVPPPGTCPFRKLYPPVAMVKSA